MICDRCNVNTEVTKIITSKKPATAGQQYTVYVCGTCKNGKFAYTFFPPKEQNGQSSEKPKDNQAVVLLQGIAQTLLRIEKILANPEKINIVESELEADETVPF